VLSDEHKNKHSNMCDNQFTYKQEETKKECCCMGCPNKSVVFQELDYPENSITGDGKDWYCAKCYKECVDEDYEIKN